MEERKINYANQGDVMKFMKRSNIGMSLLISDGKEESKG
jgi:hypothetical protein